MSDLTERLKAAKKAKYLGDVGKPMRVLVALRLTPAERELIVAALEETGARHRWQTEHDKRDSVVDWDTLRRLGEVMDGCVSRTDAAAKAAGVEW